MAQRYKRTLRGEVRIPGQGRQYYYIYYNADANRLTGSSVTESGSGDLKAGLIGRLSDDGTEMYLRETQSLDPVKPGMELCFFAARLKLTVYPDRRVWSGTFTSRQPDGSPCPGGTMTFTDLNPKPPPPPKVQAAPPVAKKTTPKPPRPPRVQAVAPVPRPDTTPVVPKPAPVAESWPDTTGLRPFYHWKDATLTFELWDGIKEDGDVVSVFWNGKPVTESLLLSLGRKSFTVPVSHNAVDTLTVLMLAEGNLPANTAWLALVGSGQRYEMELSGSYGDRRKLYFLRRDHW